MKRLNWWILAAVVASLTGWLASMESYSADRPVVFTNEMIPKSQIKSYNNVHGAMRDQSERIHSLMDGFLKGDVQVIQEHAEEISNAISQAIRDYPPPAGQESAQWKIMVGVTEQAQLMLKTSQEGNYKQSYLHFATMTNQCIECHQMRRSWGVLPTPPPPPPQETPAQTPTPAKPE